MLIVKVGMRVVEVGFPAHGASMPAAKVGLLTFKVGFPAHEAGFLTFNVGMPTFKVGFLTFKVGFLTFNVGMPTFEVGFPAHGAGFLTFNVGMPTFKVGFPTLEVGFPTFEVGFPAHGAGFLTFNVGMLTFKVGFPTFKVGFPTHGAGMLTFKVGFPTFSVGMLTFKVGFPAHGAGFPTFSVGMLTFEVDFPAHGAGFLTFNVGMLTFKVGFPAHGAGFLTFNVGMPTFEVGFPAHGAGFPTFNVGFLTFNVGLLAHGARPTLRRALASEGGLGGALETDDDALEVGGRARLVVPGRARVAPDGRAVRSWGMRSPLAPALALAALAALAACSAAPPAAEAPTAPSSSAMTPPSTAPSGSATAPSTAPSGSAVASAAPAPSAAPSATAAPPSAAPPGPARVLWAVEPVDNTSSYKLLVLPGAPVVMIGNNQTHVASPDDMFVAALGEDGAATWRKAGTASYVRAVAGAPDHLFFASEFLGKIDFEGVRAATADTAALIVKLDATGALAWGRVLGSGSYTRVGGLAATPDGGVAAALGIFAPARAGALAVPVAGGEDTVIVQHDAAGQVAWVKTFGWAGYDEPTAIVADAAGDVLVAGTRWRDKAMELPALADGRCHGWAAKLGPRGELRWLVELGADTTRLTVDRVALGAGGGLVIAGTLFGNNQLGATLLQAPGKQRTYLAALDGDGRVAWARLHDLPECLAVDAAGRLVIAGAKGVSVETADGASTPVLAFPAGTVASISDCRLDGAGHLYLAGMIKAKATIGGVTMAGPAVKRPRTSWLKPSEVGFVAKLAL